MTGIDFSKGRRISIVASILLAAIPSILVIWLFPFNEGKYLLEYTESHSETISAFDSQNSTGITIYEEGRIIDQCNIRGAFGFMLKEVLFLTTDYNSDGNKEIYLFSLSNDTLLMHSIDDFHSPELKLKNRFICTGRPWLKGA
jgi:hypothetical protein